MLGIVQAGESCNLTATMKNGSLPITLAALNSLTLTIYDKTTGKVINNRNNQSILNEHGGIVASDGTLTLRLQPSDNALVGEPGAGEKETHILRFVWTWNDGVMERTGIKEEEYNVQQLTTIQA
jgi:hypothetical protein